MSSDEIASIWIDVKADLNSAIKTIDSFVSKAKQTITINVDDRALSGLNKHLDLKVSHFKQVQSFFNSNKLIVKVDDSNLTKLNQNLTTLQDLKVTITPEVNILEIKKQFEATRLKISLDTGEIKRQIAAIPQQKINLQVITASQSGTNDFANYDKMGKTIAQTINNSLKTNLASSAINATVGNVFAGVFQNLGKSLSQDFNKGFSQSITSALNESIGSTNLVGAKLGESISKSISSKIPQTLGKEIQEDIDNILGKENIIIEKYSQARKVSRGSENKSRYAEEQGNLTRSKLLREGQELRISRDSIDNQLSNNSAATTKGLNLQKELQFNLGLSTGDRANELQKAIDEVSENLDILFNEEIKLTEERLKISKSLEIATKRVKAQREEFKLIQSEALPQSYVQAVKNVSGKDLPVNRIPKLIADDAGLKKANASAQYNIENNVIEVTSELKRAIEAGKLSAEQMNVLYHELQHAVDFDFGSVKGVNARRNNVILGKPATAKDEELPHIIPFVRQYPQPAQMAEMNAELLGRRKAKIAFDNQNKITQSENLINKYGVDGNKINELVNRQLEETKKQLFSIADFAKSKGVDVKSDLLKYIEDIKTARTSTEAVISTVVKGQNQQIPLDDLHKVDEVVNQNIENIVLLQQNLKVLELETLKRARELVEVNPPIVQENLKTLQQNVGSKPDFKLKTAINETIFELPIKSFKDFDSEILRINSTILKSFKGTYQSLKNDFKQNNLKFIDENNIGGLAKAKSLLDSINHAKNEIEQTRSDLGIPKIGTPEAQRINNLLSQLKQVENKTIIQLNKAKSQIEPNEDTGLVNQRLNRIKKGKNVAPENQENLEAINKLLDDASVRMAKFDNMFADINNGLNESFNKSAKTVDTFFQNIFNGVESLSPFEQKLVSLAGSLGKIAIGFLGFQAVITVFNKFREFSNQSIEVAANFQIIEQQLKSVSGSAIEGQKNIDILARQSKNLNLDKATVLSGAAGLIASTQNTNLEGEQTLQILQGVNTLIASRAVGKAQQQRALLAIEQMGGKGAIQAQELQTQLGQAIPGSVQIFARSQGLNPNQLRKQFQRGAFGSDSLVAFSQQARAESEAAIPDAINTAQGAANRLENSLISLQEVTGKTLLPLKSLFDNTVSSGINFVTENISLLTTGLNVLLIIASRPLWQPLLQSSLQLIPVLKTLFTDFLLNTRINGVGSLFDGFKNIPSIIGNVSKSIFGLAQAFAPIALELLAFQTVITVIESLKIQFTDLSGEVGKFADNAALGLKRLEEYRTGIKTTDKIDFAKDTYDQSKKLGKRDIFDSLNPFSTTLAKGNKTAADSLEAADKLLKSIEGLRKTSDSKFITSKIGETTALDKQLADVQVLKRATIQKTPEQNDLINSLTKQETEIVKKRFESFKPIGDLQGQVVQRIADLKATQKNIDSQAEQGFIFEENYNKYTSSIKEEIVELEKLQNSLTQTIGKVRNEFQQLQLELEKVDNRLLDNRVSIENSNQANRNQIDSRYNQNSLTAGNAEYLNKILAITTSLQQLSNQRNSVAQSEALFASDSAKRVINKFGVNQSTGINEIKYLAKDAENPNDKYILEQYAKLKQDKLEIGKLTSDVLQARRQLNDSIIEQSKQIIDYYKNIQRQNETSALEVAKINQTILSTGKTNKIRDLLTNGFDGAITQYLEAVISDIDALNQKTLRKFDVDKINIDKNNQVFDLQKSTLELQRTLPSSDFKIPVTLDIDSLNSDETIKIVSDGLSSVNDELKLSGEQIADFNLKTGDSNTIVDSLNTGVVGVDKSVKTVNSSADNLNSSLSKLPETTTIVKNGFDSILGTIANIGVETVKWLTGLGNAPNLFNQITSLFSGVTNNITSQPGENIIQQGINFLGKAINANIKPGVVGFVEKSKSSREYDGGHIGDDIFAPIGSRILSPVNGTVTQSREGGTRNTDDANPLVPGYQPQNLVVIKLDMPIEFEGRKIAYLNMRHLVERNVQVGQKIKMGDLIGAVGEAGGSGAQFGAKIPGTAKDADASHLHIEYSPGDNNQRDSLPDALASRLSEQLSRNFKLPAYSPQVNTVVNERGSGRIAVDGLTALGKKAQAYANDSRVQAFLRAIAIAEVGEELVNKGSGYGKQIGGNYGRDDFTNPSALTRIPASLPGRGGQNAFGRYQIHQVDFDDAKQALGVKNLSPENQEIIGVRRLMLKGALEPLLRGDLKTAMQKASNEFASIQGSVHAGDGLNATTSGGRTSIFLKNYNAGLARADYNPSSPQAPKLTRSQMGTYVNYGLTTGVSAIEENRKASIAQSRVEDEKADKERLRAFDKQLESLRKSQRELGIQSRNTQKTQADNEYAGIYNPTPTQKYKKDVTDRKFEIEQLSTDTKEKLLEVSRQRDLIVKSLADTNLPENYKKPLRAQLAGYEDAIKKLNAFNSQIEKNGTARIKVLEQTFKRESSIRSRDANFANSQEDINLDLKRLELVKQRAVVAPHTAEAATIPNLEAVINLKQQSLQSERELASLEQDRFDNKITQSDFDKRSASLKAQSAKSRELIALKESQANRDFNFKELNRNRDNKFSYTQEDLNLSQKELEVMKQRAAINPYSDEAKAIPKLETILSLKQQDLEIERSIAALQQDRFDTKIDNAEYEKRVALLRKQGDETKKLIDLKEKQATTEYEFKELNRKLDAYTDITAGSTNINSSQIAQLERLYTKSTSLDTGELAAKRLEAFNLANKAQEYDFQKQQTAIIQLGATGQRTNEEVDVLYEKLSKLNDLKLEDIKNQFNDLLDADRIKEFDRQINDLTNQQTLDSYALNARKESLTKRKSINGNPFVANRTNRDIGAIEENNRYSLENLNVERQIQAFKDSGIVVADEKIASIKQNLLDIHNIKLGNLADQFKTIGATLTDITMQGVKGLSSGLADLVTKGGDLGDVMDNLFGSILNQALNMGINSLLGGVFGGMFAEGGNVGVSTSKSDNLQQSLLKERSMSGRKGILAVVHEGEFLIPASRFETLEKAGLSADKLLHAPLTHFANGGMVGNTTRSSNNSGVMGSRPGNNSVTIKLETTVINNQEYITKAQATQLAEYASEKGAQKGANMVRLSMQNSQVYRDSVGMG